LHFHLPKPLHGWRAFAGEVGIIVVGVLIALGAEQVVEDLHWKERVREAEASMTKQLGEDDGVQAATRVAISPCIARRLDGAEQALIATRDRGVPFISPKLATPPFRTWDNDSWRAAVSSDATSHMATDRMYAWSAPFDLTADMDQAQVREFNDWAELSRINTLSPHPSEAERERMFDAIAHARQDNAFLSWISGVFLRSLKPLDIEVPEAAKRKELLSQRRQIGC
jgi:hypothetical protein